MNDFHVKCDRAIELLGTETDAIIVVPPFADLYRPSLGVHMLQAAVGRAGLRVKVLYANLLFAILSGEDLYKIISEENNGGMWGERIFAAAAFGLPPLGYNGEKLRGQLARNGQGTSHGATFEQFANLEQRAVPFCSALAERLATPRFRVVGATTTFHQTTASVALLAQVKRVSPTAITIIGGANCEGEMARGIASLGAPIDFIFSGECESAFPDFLRRVVDGKTLPDERIVRGQPCADLDSLPEPSFDDYFAQLDIALPSWRQNEAVSIPYETSRGCWWGARQHCTFCGLNGETMAFREKSPERAIAGAKRLLDRYPPRQLELVDNILPHSYFRTVLPRLAKELPSAQIFYEVKANLNLEQVALLRRAGVTRVQPGIEALSSSLLRRMKKGVLGRQNLALLRYARAVGLLLKWNLLCGFPGDRREDYQSTLAIMPLIHHLIPPSAVCPLSLDRFSPYFNDPAVYGITQLEPHDGYRWSFPPQADLRSLAYHYSGKYRSVRSDDHEVVEALERACRDWRDSWRAGAPVPALSLAAGRDGYYTLMDTRGLEGTDMFHFLDEEEARTVLIGGPIDRQPLANWAMERKLAVELDGWCAPLAVANLNTWHRLESRDPLPACDPLPAAV